MKKTRKKKEKQNNYTLEEPKDIYKSYKIPLKSILIDTTINDKLFDALNRTNKIVILTYQFLRLYILQKYNTTNKIPEIDEDEEDDEYIY